MAGWRNWAVITLTATAIGVAGADQPKPAAIPPAGATTAAPTASTTPTPAKADPLATMLSEAKAAYAKMRDYTGTFTRQERINGVLGPEQVAEMKMRVQPVGVAVRFARPDSAAGMEVLYSAAARDGKVRYRPAGIAGRKGFQKLDVDDSQFLAANRHPVPEWGIGGILDRVANAVAREKTLNNPVEVYTAEYQFAGRAVTRYEILTRRPHAFRSAARMIVYVDNQTRLPVRFEAYDDPKPGNPTGDLLEAYSYTDLKWNTGLGESTFTD
jgi:hypothetical protein